MQTHWLFRVRTWRITTIKIVVVSTNAFAVPLQGYGGLEQIAWQCATGLHDLGHEVTLIAPKGSTAPCPIIETTLGEPEMLSARFYRERVQGADVVIDHSWNKFVYLFHPHVIGVCHAPIATMYATPPPVEKPCLVGISENHAQAIQTHLKVDARTCYNGVDGSFYAPGGERGERYLFLARMSSIKSPDIALNVAKGYGLDLVGDASITNEPQLADTIQRICALMPLYRFIGNQSRQQCVKWFRRSKALLHCTFRWPEPFGLTLIEAQLCGCPVLAPAHGSCPELVKDKETGFICNTPDDMRALIESNAIDTIRPERCRQWGELFSIERMVKRYEALAQECLEKGW